MSDNAKLVMFLGLVFLVLAIVKVIRGSGASLPGKRNSRQQKLVDSLSRYRFVVIVRTSDGYKHGFEDFLAGVMKELSLDVTLDSSEGKIPEGLVILNGIYRSYSSLFDVPHIQLWVVGLDLNAQGPQIFNMCEDRRETALKILEYVAYVLPRAISRESPACVLK